MVVILHGIEPGGGIQQIIYLLGSFGIPASEKDNYEVFLDNVLIRNTFVFPFTGVNGEVSIKKKAGRCIVLILPKSTKGDAK